MSDGFARLFRTNIGRSLCGLALILSTPAVVSAQMSVDAAGVGSQFELAFWQAVAASNDAAQYEAYLQRYPQGTFSGLARVKIGTLRPSTTTAPASAPTPAPAPAAAPLPAAATTASAPAPAVATAASAPATAPAVATAEPAAPATGTVRPYSTPGAVRAALPVRPTLAAFRPVEVPSGFCSPEARDDYYNETFRPAAESAADNNQKANAYLKALQEQFDDYQRNQDVTGANITAQESAAYGEIASAAFHISSDFSTKYDELMKMPIGGCK